MVFSTKNFNCAIIHTVLLLLFTTLCSTSSDSDIKVEPTLSKCTSSQQCDEICFNGGELANRCDSNGICVCDCHDKSIIGNASYTDYCAGKQPDGDPTTTCHSYCTQEYQRPSRYCTTSSGNSYCTAICNNSTQNAK